MLYIYIYIYIQLYSKTHQFSLTLTHSLSHFYFACDRKKKMEQEQEQEQEQQLLLHFCDSKHPLVLGQGFGGSLTCCGCQELVYGPSYYCGQCSNSSQRRYRWYNYLHHKSCAEVPLGLHHPCTQSILLFSLPIR